MKTPFNVNPFKIEITYKEVILQLKRRCRANFNEGKYFQHLQNKKMPKLYLH